ncbi:hypothetical protein A8C56_01020 [Niabella ginsenosidivorans]|uniref:Uncharacterized protein n=1 Tax=Niabella ginsenosidivorans TaxID=1176587 RepID=A0A1A9HZJ7_9BACT|nr:hypothetical protein A8C56_01020 [Niabella ginsenosidivorans]
MASKIITVHTFNRFIFYAPFIVKSFAETKVIPIVKVTPKPFCHAAFISASKITIACQQILKKVQNDNLL